MTPANESLSDNSPPPSFSTPLWLTARPIAHRGLHDGNHLPENSLGAFKAAIAHNLPIECDVHLLADGQVAVFHDTDLKRLVGESVQLAELTAHELKNFRLYETEYSIPLLSEVLEQVGGKVPLLIELKNYRLGAGALEQAVCSCLQHYSGEYALQSFNPLSLLWLKRHFPQALRGQLGGIKAMGSTLRRFTQPHFLACNIEELSVPVTMRLRAINLPLLAWTIRTPEQYRKAQNSADNIIFELGAGVPL